MKHVKVTAFDCPDAWFQNVKSVYEVKATLFKWATAQKILRQKNSI